LDLSKFRVGDWILVVAGALMLLLGLAVHWATIHANGVRYPGTRNAFDYPLTGGLAWLLTVAAAVVTFLLAARLIPRGTIRWTRITLGATTLATLLMLLRLALGGGRNQHVGVQVVSLGRGAGMYIALLAAIAALVGAVVNLHAEGDSIGDVLSTFTRRDDTANGKRPLPPPNPGTPPREPPTASR
jgi:hypothetical protein